MSLQSCYYYRLTGSEIKEKANQNLPMEQDLTVANLKIKQVDTIVLAYSQNSVQITVSLSLYKNILGMKVERNGTITFTGSPLVLHDTIFFSNIKVDRFNFFGDLWGMETAISNFIVDKYFRKVPLYNLSGIEKCLLQNVYVNDNDKLVVKIGLF
jgi:hypothetical protein